MTSKTKARNGLVVKTRVRAGGRPPPGDGLNHNARKLVVSRRCAAAPAT